MKSQRVTVMKGGLNFSLNARCSLIAASSIPLTLDKSISLNHKKVGISDSLFSCFDLVFAMKDENY